MGRPPLISREQILHAARATFIQKGFAAATLADIAAELKVTAAAILRHFESKQTLFQAAMQQRLELPDCISDLAAVDASTDPHIVLRRLAEEWIPFARTALVHNLVISMHEQSNPTLVMPFNPRADDSPPKRGLVIVTDYFRRAKKAGVVQIDEPRAAALLFMGSLLSYIFIHYVMRVTDEPYPLEKYIDALLDLWTRGAIVTKEKKSGGFRGNNKNARQANRAGHRDRDRRDRAARVHEGEAAAEAARPLRHARGAHGQRRIARRRPRDKNSDR